MRSSAGFVNARSKEELLSLFGSLKDQANAAYNPDGTTEFAEMLTMVNTDKVWAEPARFTARAFAAGALPPTSTCSPTSPPRCGSGCATARRTRPRSLRLRHAVRPGASQRRTQGPGDGQDDEHLLGELRQDR